MAGHVYVDETKAKGYIMVAAVLQQEQLRPARIQMRQLLRPGVRRLHFNHEKDALRRRTLATIESLGCGITVYDASALADTKLARDVCLERILEDAVSRGDRTLIFEQDDSLVKSDHHVLHMHLYKLGYLGGPIDAPHFDHLRPHEESLLWIPDAVAWCWARGGDWKRQVMPFVSHAHIS